MGLEEPILSAVAAQGYRTPTPIQKQSIPYVLNKRDMLGCAQTGTGKTAAFSLPMIQLLAKASASERHGKRSIRALVLAPTRELAIQIDESFRAYGKGSDLRCAVVYGGVGLSPQIDQLKRGLDILIATPGRLLDLQGQGYVDFRHVEIFVLDEADRMLDMGFIHDVRKIIAVLPPKRQNLLFSATMPREIQGLADKLLHDPAKVAVAAVSSTAETVEQKLFQVDKKLKTRLLVHLFNEDPAMLKALVFTRTKHGANRLSENLEKNGIKAEAIHGNKSQSARQRALSNFKSGTIRVLVASDLAARGLDVEEITHVVNFDFPNIPETYVHRIGRTGRAEATGIAISFCDQEEKAFVRDAERLIGRKIPVIENHPFPMGTAVTADDRDNESRDRDGGSRGGRGGGGGRHGSSRPDSRNASAPRPSGGQAPRPDGAPKRRRRRRPKPAGGS